MPRKARRDRRNVCFVSGTRAEFGLMEPVLHAIVANPALNLQLIITGMQLDPSRGRSINALRKAGWFKELDHAIVPWKPGTGASDVAIATGTAMTGIARALRRMRSDIVLVCGDRVEAFAGAAAGHIAGRVVVHVHGGDRALGLVDDSLRHAVTKLSHTHFAATPSSGKRIARLGEDSWRIHVVGAPGIDGIRRLAHPNRASRGPFILLVMHPACGDAAIEAKRAKQTLDAVAKNTAAQIVIVHPNNDPGSEGIVRCWEKNARGERFKVHRDVARPEFLAMLRDAAMLVGNSSSGIIEAATFGTPVINIGPRQQGRERSGNVTDVPYTPTAIAGAVRRIWNDGRPLQWRGRNVYGGQGTSRRIAAVLSKLRIDDRLVRKLITY